MFFSTASMAVLGFTSYASAHMLLAQPPPYAGVINSPLSADGSNFPCQLKFDDSTTAATSIALGSVQPLDFTGGATHGGGSCQISITYDDPPTVNSTFKVIQSIEGGCPIKNNAGNVGDDASSPDPDTYSFTMPTNLPTGKAVLAWTWFNKVGNREMYMNCAPIDITSGSSKRSELMERDQTAYLALPDMFTANIKNIGNDACATKETIDLVFPNSGPSVSRPGLQANYGPPVGTCVGGTDASESSPASGSGSTATAAPAASTSTTAPGGVFATTAPASSAAVATTLATSVASVAATSATPAASPSTSPAASPSGTGAMTAGSACTPEGLWNCIGGTSFQQCASGTWSVVQSLAAGTQCTPGQTTAIDITASNKRAIRFSSEHVRRHMHRST